MKELQQAARDRRKVVRKEFNNAEWRKRRLKSRAMQLTNNDLLEIMFMRQDARASTAASSSSSTAAMSDTASNADAS